jgi:hypothetical protein
VHLPVAIFSAASGARRDAAGRRDLEEGMDNASRRFGLPSTGPRPKVLNFLSRRGVPQ